MKCAICNIDNTSKLLVKNSFNVVKCKNCGLVYINPRLTEKELTNFYSSGDYHAEHHDGNRQIWMREKFDNRISLIETFCKKRGKILDVGCNYGSLIYNSYKFGYKKVYGLDINSENIKIGKN